MSLNRMGRGSGGGCSQGMLHGVTAAGACAATALALLIGSHAFAQEPPPGGIPPSNAATAGAPPGLSTSKDPKLLAPLPPPSAEDLKRNPPSPDPRNLEGIWLSAPRTFFGPPPGAAMPYTDSAKQRQQKMMQRAREADTQGKVVLSDAGRCRPMGGIGVGGDLFPGEIIQTPDKIVILQEEGRGRWVIHMKGEHPKDLTPSFFGHSVGRWEGDTLVVDTVGLRATDGMFGFGMRSDKARVVSRLRKVAGGGKLEMTSTTHDPETYTQPFQGPKDVYDWHPELAFLEFQCEENMEGAREGMIE